LSKKKENPKAPKSTGGVSWGNLITEKIMGGGEPTRSTKYNLREKSRKRSGVSKKPEVKGEREGGDSAVAREKSQGAGVNLRKPERKDNFAVGKGPCKTTTGVNWGVTLLERWSEESARRSPTPGGKRKLSDYEKGISEEKVKNFLAPAGIVR